VRTGTCENDLPVNSQYGLSISLREAKIIFQKNNYGVKKRPDIYRDAFSIKQRIN